MSRPFYQNFDVSKELVEEAFKILDYVVLNIGKEAISVGTNDTTKRVESGKAKFVYIAKDTDPPEIVAHLPPLCDGKGIPYIFVPNKKDLAIHCDSDIPYASVSILELGDAKERLEELKNKIYKIREKI